MSEEPYQNREIDNMFNEIKDIMYRVEEQTKRTNGRVTALERWKYTIIGALTILTTIVVPILGWALYTIVNITTTVHEAVDDALSAYSINNSQ